MVKTKSYKEHLLKQLQNPKEAAAYLDAALHDPVAQSVRTQHVVLTEGGVRLYPVQLRYAYPSELDLMARLAGMRLRERWGDWNREPFRAASQGHVSVYELATATSRPR